MFKIERLRLEILTVDENTDRKYGFDIPFETGLNIIAGKNSKGKSTISSCIYYALGMEELLGGQNQKSLDKALKTEFNTYNKLTGEIERGHKILVSKILIEISNPLANKIATIVRYINPGPSINENRVKNVLVHECRISEISTSVIQYPLFLRHTNNNENDFGFYHWLADFIGFQLPIVSSTSKSGGESPLYLQTIFPAFFIEQTKGWSDFLATCPYFGIPNNREKTIEFLLDLNELVVSIERDRISKRERELKDQWSLFCAKVNLLASEYQGNLMNLPAEITPDRSDLLATALFVKDFDEPENLSSITDLVKKYQQEITEMLKVPLKRVAENKEYLRSHLENKSQEQNIFMERLSEFDSNFELQKHQFVNLHQHLVNIKKELADQKGIQNVFDEAIIKEAVFNKCPTCTQTVSVDLMEVEGVVIEKLTLQENIAYLEGQKNIIDGTIKSLQKVIDEKGLIRKYYTRKQRELEEEIKSILRELIADDRAYSETDALSRVTLERRVSDLISLDTRFKEHIEEMQKLSAVYKDLIKDKSILESNTEEDKAKLENFESAFKNYLFAFGYSSNEKRNIYIQQKQPFRYFPVFKFSQDDSQPQSVRINSSASDFVRSIWAYSITLLEKAPNHAGLIVLDEPGQHSVSSTSLKALFKTSAKFSQSQVIIFSSVERKGEDNHWNIDELVGDMIEGTDYHLYTLDEAAKSIDLLRD